MKLSLTVSNIRVRTIGCPRAGRAMRHTNCLRTVVNVDGWCEILYQMFLCFPCTVEWRSRRGYKKHCVLLLISLRKQTSLSFILFKGSCCISFSFLCYSNFCKIDNYIVNTNLYSITIFKHEPPIFRPSWKRGLKIINILTRVNWFTYKWVSKVSI